jgi:mannose-6-phosphate isomerase-like protein (cupin superfamily)
MKKELLNKGKAFFYIDEEGLDYSLTREEAAYKIAEGKYTVKIEGLEYLYPESNSVHGFISPKDAKSFPTHTDSVDLKIVCIEGTKTIEVGGTKYILNKGEYLNMKKNTKHQALNDFNSIILSVEV